MTVQWRKSSHSGGADDQHCVEVGRLVRGVGVRDSKNPSGGHLTLTATQFSALLDQIKHTSPAP
ncbi:DUF397 domain-containing protein [Actinomadura craniellae]|uniref:DUF397 domain-containing protein n=1 Tax=Actinomadura craniellae TaxID=2231787 RepID=A0A365H0K2_9ACTN|nr:DUF397 domain-containing protein [Actinomadura craniellae]RAY12609.1 DUF397 domain-containing protein [Actinomadura craniellae]